MARDDFNKRAHSERVGETASERQKEERQRERDRAKPKPESDGKKPSELRTTSRSRLDDRIDEKEGPQALRTKEEMSLHEEISRTGDDDRSRGNDRTADRSHGNDRTGEGSRGKMRDRSPENDRTRDRSRGE